MSWTKTNQSNKICTALDDFLDEKTIWIATLSDGTKVYQDDERPGITEHSAWIRLGWHIQNTGLRIVALQARFRSHVEEIPRNAPGYFFARGALGHFGGKTRKSSTKHYLIMGAQNGDEIPCHWYKAPELLIEKTVVKKLSEVESPYFIQNPP